MEWNWTMGSSLGWAGWVGPAGQLAKEKKKKKHKKNQTKSLEPVRMFVIMRRYTGSARVISAVRCGSL